MLEGLFQPMHLVVVLVIVLVIFGPRKLPQIGAGLGKSIREFKKALSSEEKTSVSESKREPRPQGTTEDKK